MSQDYIIERDRSDRILVLTKKTWTDYEQIIENNPNCCISYLNNVIKIVYPSRNHKRIATTIGILINAYCRKHQIPYFALGSSDIKKPFVAGKQPDASYCFKIEKNTPDLAIEVDYTSGGINDLESYKLLNVPEVWIYHNNAIAFYQLENSEYIKRSVSFSLCAPSTQVDLVFNSDFLNQYVNRGLKEDNFTIETDFFNAL